MIRFVIARAILFLLVSGGTCWTASAQIDRWGYWENGVSEAWWFSPEQFSKTDADLAIAKWREIGADLSSVQTDSWPGDYFAGDDTHGVFLRWSEKAFVMVHVDKCQAKVMGLSYGKVAATPSEFIFVSEFTNKSKSDHSHNSHPTKLTFVPIKWRGTFMLIAESEIADFGDYVAGLGKYNYNDFSYVEINEFFFKPSPTDIRDNERPQLPAAYERFLKPAITASILEVKSPEIKKEYSFVNPDGTGTSYGEPVTVTKVKINAGSNQGLSRGMFLHVTDNNEGDSVRLVKVEKTTATGVIVRNLVDGKELFFDGDSNEGRVHSRIKPGLHLTTAQLR